MAIRKSRRRSFLKKLMKAVVVVLCTAGFLFQTFEFLALYWTYPTVVDIQVSIPSEIDMPAISICNTNGMKIKTMCAGRGLVCVLSRMNKYADICSLFKDACGGGVMPKDFRAVLFQNFFANNDMNTSYFKDLRIPLDDYFKCKIVSGADKRDCDTANAKVGSYFSESSVPNFCYTLYSHWGNPEAKVEKIKKSEKIELEFYIDCSFRNRTADLDEVQLPKHNCITSSSVQMAIHSRYLVASPFVSGTGFLGGKKYKVKIKQDEKHLLPPPYQTNCTDYMPAWIARGGVGPLTQLMVIEECRFNAYLKELGCVPFFIDYPHNETICKFCDNSQPNHTCDKLTPIGSHCTDLLRDYNQPCDMVSYDMEVEEKLVNIEKKFKSIFMTSTESLSVTTKGFNCTRDKIYTRRCQTINIEIVFSEFQITNVTYNPKYENIELFSVIGGYMGVYLGISIITVYDIAEILATILFSSLKKHRKQKKKKKLLAKKKKNSLWGLRLDYHISPKKAPIPPWRYPRGFRKRSIRSFTPRDF